MDGTKTTRVVVGSTAGRGPCDGCGLIAELVQVEERVAYAPGFVRLRDLCLPEALGGDEFAPLPRLALRKAA
jgi:hypothetical protein